MRGVVAAITSCIGGKDERYAIKVSASDRNAYFVYKTMSDFDKLWEKLEAIASDVKGLQTAAMAENAPKAPDVSLLAKWLASFVDHFAFRLTVQRLRAEEKETISTLNVLIQALVRRVSALYVENTILRCGCCPVGRQMALLVRNFLEFAHLERQRKHPSIQSPPQRKRQLSEMRPEDANLGKRSMAVFPVLCEGMFPRSPKARKLSVSSSDELFVPMIQKVGLNKPVMAAAMPARRRVFAEVDISI
ncbi:hypothetical protein ATCC90586_001796 [Pythium insidiosum]|nr:hypothetical protein ATCC90586_001796 [Pythium insidiosum]